MALHEERKAEARAQLLASGSQGGEATADVPRQVPAGVHSDTDLGFADVHDLEAGDEVEEAPKELKLLSSDVRTLLNLTAGLTGGGLRRAHGSTDGSTPPRPQTSASPMLVEDTPSPPEQRRESLPVNPFNPFARKRPAEADSRIALAKRQRLAFSATGERGDKAVVARSGAGSASFMRG